MISGVNNCGQCQKPKECHILHIGPRYTGDKIFQYGSFMISERLTCPNTNEDDKHMNKEQALQYLSSLLKTLGNDGN